MHSVLIVITILHFETCGKETVVIHVLIPLAPTPWLLMEYVLVSIVRMESSFWMQLLHQNGSLLATGKVCVGYTL